MASQVTREFNFLKFDIWEPPVKGPIIGAYAIKGGSQGFIGNSCISVRITLLWSEGT